MRRNRFAVVLLVSALSLGVTFPGSAATAVDFAGVWTSVDIDGSHQIMVIRNKLQVTLFDDDATVACPSGGNAVVWGKGKIKGANSDRLKVKNATVQCADGGPSATFTLVFRLRPNGTLRDGSGVVWAQIYR